MTKAGKPQNPVWTFDAILRANKGWCQMDAVRCLSVTMLAFLLLLPAHAAAQGLTGAIDLPGNS